MRVVLTLFEHSFDGGQSPALVGLLAEREAQLERKVQRSGQILHGDVIALLVDAQNQVHQIVQQTSVTTRSDLIAL